jgi:hypothetical protein
MKDIKQIREEHSQLTKALQTALTLEKYMGRVLKDKKLDAGMCAYFMEETFGEEIHNMVAGLVRYVECVSTDLDTNDIRVCLAHDLGGALNRDKFMLPRCSSYAEFVMLEEGESVEDYLEEKRSQAIFLQDRKTEQELGREKIEAEKKKKKKQV